jgi:hypothetical protein
LILGHMTNSQVINGAAHNRRLALHCSDVALHFRDDCDFATIPLTYTQCFDIRAVA